MFGCNIRLPKSKTLRTERIRLSAYALTTIQRRRLENAIEDECLASAHIHRWNNIDSFDQIAKAKIGRSIGDQEFKGIFGLPRAGFSWVRIEHKSVLWLRDDLR